MSKLPANWRAWERRRVGELRAAGYSRQAARSFAHWEAPQRHAVARKIGDEAAMNAGLWCEPQAGGRLRMRLVLEPGSIPLDLRPAALSECSDVWADWPCDGEVPRRAIH